MSNQQYPGNGDPRSPWAQPDPNWRPTQFQDHAGRDPRQPFGQRVEGPSMQELTPPKKPMWPWILLALGVVAALLVFLLFQPEEPVETASEQPVPSAFPTPTITGNAVPFEGNGTGLLEVTGHSWTSDGIEVRYRITVDDGTRRFAFFAFDNETRSSYLPDEDDVIEVSAGSPFEGTVTFTMPQGDASFVLTTLTGRAITALPISG